MPPSPAELVDWWLSVGLDDLRTLFENEEDALGPKNVGYAQAIQSKLRAFDYDPKRQARFHADWIRVRESGAHEFEVNTLPRIRQSIREIFKHLDDGGFDYDRALEGLADIDAQEVHRLKVMGATKKALETLPSAFRSNRVVEELDHASKRRYGKIHLAIRALILLHHLDLEEEGTDDQIETMALINGLFPSSVHLEDSEDFDPTPYTMGLRESIRFTLFEHLLSQDPFSQKQFRTIKMKLTSWCNVPSYEDARHDLLRYAEESKKLEEACFALMNAIDRRDSATTAGSGSSKSKGKSSTNAQSPTALMTSFEGKDYDMSESHLPPKVSSAPPVPNPLLDGVPGREILGAQTNPGAFVSSSFGEKDSRNTKTCLSKTEYHQHPLAPFVTGNSAEKAALGLYIPKEIICRESD